MEMFDKIIFNDELISKLIPKFTKGCKFGGNLTDFLNCDIDIYGDITKGEYTLIQNLIITHSGSFHADEVFSIALIMLIRISLVNKKLKKMGYKYVIKLSKHHIINTVFRVPNIESIDDSVFKDNKAIVIDIIGGHYDHHQANIEDRPTTNDLEFCHHDKNTVNGTPIATFGALWNAVSFLFDCCYESDADIFVDDFRSKIYTDFIEPIDLMDCKGPRCIKSPVSRIISNLSDYSAYEYNFVAYSPIKRITTPNPVLLPSNFIEAILLAYKIFRDEILKQQKVLSAVADVYKYCSFSTIPNKSQDSYGCKDDLAVCEMNKLEDENSNVSINLETLDYVKVKNLNCTNITPLVEIFVNHNPNIRDNAYRFIVRDSTKVRLSDEIIKGDIPGKIFAHPSGFMISFDSDEHLCDFLKHVYVKFSFFSDEERCAFTIYYE